MILQIGTGGKRAAYFLCTVIQTIKSVNGKLKAPHEALASNDALMLAPKATQSRPAMQMQSSCASYHHNHVTYPPVVPFMPHRILQPGAPSPLHPSSPMRLLVHGLCISSPQPAVALVLHTLTKSLKPRSCRNRGPHGPILPSRSNSSSGTQSVASLRPTLNSSLLLSSTSNLLLSLILSP